MMLPFILLVCSIISRLSFASVITPKQSLPSSIIVDDTDICQTIECKQSANDIIKNMDVAINPCDDFYKFACGGYIARNTIPDDKSSIGVFLDVQEELNRQLKELMDRQLDESTPKFVDMIKYMYYSCMNLESIEESNSEPLKKILNSLGGWPVVQGNNWDDSNFDWKETVFNLRKLGYSSDILLTAGITADFKNNTVNIIAVGDTSLGMPDRSYLINGLDDPATEAYFNLMVKAANKLGADELTSRKELLDALKFEMTLASYTLPPEQYRNFTALYNIYTVRDFTKLVPQANAMISFIGYPQELVNDSLVLEHYRNLTITVDSYFNNVLSLKKWQADISFSKLREKNIKGDWKTHAMAAMVNAFYHPIENSIDFPAGILQKAFFNKDRPNYMNFGGIGFVIGHEITHGFDDMGRQFDKDGNNRNWWDDDTDQHFREKAKCIIEQYGNYTAENGMKLNGINTQGENIADNGGMKEAYVAYHSWVKDNGQEKKLPGLDYTTSQLFWISAANIWCTKQRPETLKSIIISDSHSPAPFRVIGPMSNFPEFAKDFQCPLGSPMNPEHKCKVW